MTVKGTKSRKSSPRLLIVPYRAEIGEQTLNYLLAKEFENKSVITADFSAVYRPGFLKHDSPVHDSATFVNDEISS